MRVATIEPITVSVPYRHREVSSVIARDGVTNVLVKVTTDDGLEGWGESCSGADVVSIEAAVRAMSPFVVGRSPWNREAMRSDLYRHGLWQFRAPTGNFAWAGIDIALLDICAKAVGEPVYRLLGGLRRAEATYFYYLARGTSEELAGQCADGREAGFDVFYLKVGSDLEREVEMVHGGAGSARIRSPPPPRRERKLDIPRGAAGDRGPRRLRHRLRRAAGSREPDRTDGRPASAIADPDRGQRGTLDRRGRLRSDQGEGGRRLLLQPVLGRLPCRLSAPGARRPSGGPRDLQAHAR